ncbi:hypothetical protein KI387_030572, partial [Taxus chinensis]
GGSHDGSDDNIIPGLDENNIAMSCLVRTSRSDYGALALVTRRLNSLVRNGELYVLSRWLGIVEHWGVAIPLVLFLNQQSFIIQSWALGKRCLIFILPRKLCSGFFLDGKFYVIGGMISNTESLTCGEEFNLETSTWRKIPNMYPGGNGAAHAPPLVAVVNDQRYAVEYS